MPQPIVAAKPPPAEARRDGQTFLESKWMLTVCAGNVHCRFLPHPQMFTPWKLLPYRACAYLYKLNLSPCSVLYHCLSVYNTPCIINLSVYNNAVSLFICVWYHPSLLVQLYTTTLPAWLDNKCIELPSASTSSSERLDYLIPAFLCTHVCHFFIPSLP